MFKDYFKCYKKQLSLKGRLSRDEFISLFVRTWIFIALFLIVAILLLMLLLFMISTFHSTPDTSVVSFGIITFLTMITIIGIVFFGFRLLVCIIVRRLHDLDKSGYYLLLPLFPPFKLYLIYLLFFKSGNSHANKYGPPPSKAT